MIEAIGLTKEFIRQEKRGKKTKFAAVDNMTMSAGKGEILGVLGPNGAGKTTLLRMLGSLMEPTSGTARLVSDDGSVITDTKEKKRLIGYLSENTKLYGRFSVRELLRIVGSLYDIDADTLERRLDDTCELLSMGEYIDHRVDKLSTGQKQRVSIARCLMADPDHYILDEPTLGLDIISSKTIIDFMKRERDRGKCVLYSTHYMEEAETLCDRIIMLDHGRMIAEGTPASLKTETGTANLRDTFFRMMQNGSANTEDTL